MALFSALLFLTLPGSGEGSFIAFYLVFMGLFLTAGLGSGSTFQMIAVIFRKITIYRVKLHGGTEEQAQREAVTDTAAWDLSPQLVLSGASLSRKRLVHRWR